VADNRTPIAHDALVARSAWDELSTNPCHAGSKSLPMVPLSKTSRVSTGHAANRMLPNERAFKFHDIWHSLVPIEGT